MDPFATIEITNTTIQRTWAPEIWKDPKTKKVHIIVSLGTNNPDFTTNLYTATNDALTEWEGPVVMEGIPSNYIDTVLVYKDGVYHAFTKGCRIQSMRWRTMSRGLIHLYRLVWTFSPHIRNQRWC